MQIADHAQRLLDELDAGWLEVIKIPGRDGGYVRCVCRRNAEWYRRFCAGHQGWRRRHSRPRTIIKRCHTRAALLRIIAGKRQGVYIERLLEFFSHNRVTVKIKVRIEIEATCADF